MKASGSGSESTIELPERFDSKGRKKSDDPIGEKIEEFLQGKGGASKLFKNLTDGLLGEGSGSGSSRSARRRRSSRRSSRRGGDD